MMENALKRKINAALGRGELSILIRGARILNVFCESFETADIAVSHGIIVGVGDYSDASAERVVDAEGRIAVPSFIDGHVHLESALISPKEYSAAVLGHGTAAVVADPHEIANVLGMRGVRYMLDITEDIPLDVYFTAPSCVPATAVDETGGVISSSDVQELLADARVLGLAEMMNYPGVLSGDAEVLAKLSAARDAGLVIDGHAPSLSKRELNAYITSGVRSDHECTTAEEALEKLSRGQWIMIREGTACKNLLSLLPLLKHPYSARCMLVTDDKHPGELLHEGHIDHAVRLAIRNGADPILAYKAAAYNPAVCFGLTDRGAIAPGYRADIILLDDLSEVKISAVYKDGVDVRELLSRTDKAGAASSIDATHTVKIPSVTSESFRIRHKREKIIELIPGEILTRDGGYAEKADPEHGICKIAVIERHGRSGNIGVGFLSGYGIASGAVATSVAHDSHNLIIAGVSDSDMALAARRIAELGGGMAVVRDGEILAELALPIAGLMCELSADEAHDALTRVKSCAYSLGISHDIDPFMTLSFASLPVIPSLRITTHGVFDVGSFSLV